MSEYIKSKVSFALCVLIGNWLLVYLA